jgi:DNA-directed RNA polymerase specialized sigma24 family protein
MNLQENHLKILHQIAWAFSKKCNISVEDLYSEACVHSLEQINKFDASRGAISTFLHAVTYNHLVQYSRKQRTVLDTDFTETSYRNPEQSLMFLERLNRLSKESQDLCSRILNNPDQFGSMKLSEISKSLREQNWSWPKIRKSFSEIREVLK